MLRLASVPDGSGAIFLDDLGCNGTESRLVDCANAGIGIHNCNHFEDVGVRCLATSPTPGNLALRKRWLSDIVHSSINIS